MACDPARGPERSPQRHAAGLDATAPPHHDQGPNHELSDPLSALTARAAIADLCQEELAEARLAVDRLAEAKAATLLRLDRWASVLWALEAAGDAQMGVLLAAVGELRAQVATA